MSERAFRTEVAFEDETREPAESEPTVYDRVEAPTAELTSRGLVR